MTEFELKDTDFIPLCNLLSATGLAENGGQAKAFISEGLVYVDGQVELKKRCKVRSGQVVEFAGESVKVL